MDKGFPMYLGKEGGKAVIRWGAEQERVLLNQISMHGSAL